MFSIRTCLNRCDMHISPVECLKQNTFVHWRNSHTQDMNQVQLSAHREYTTNTSELLRCHIWHACKDHPLNYLCTCGLLAFSRFWPTDCPQLPIQTLQINAQRRPWSDFKCRLSSERNPTWNQRGLVQEQARVSFFRRRVRSGDGYNVSVKASKSSTKRPDAPLKTGEEQMTITAPFCLSLTVLKYNEVEQSPHYLLATPVLTCQNAKHEKCVTVDGSMKRKL